MDCKACNKQFPVSIVVDGRRRNLQRRKYCLDCSPLGAHNTKKLHVPVPDRCEFCEQSYRYKRGNGGSKKVCPTCTTLLKRKNLKKQCVELKGGKCEICGYNKSIAALEFHHTNPSVKEFSIAYAYTKTWAQVIQELDKCQLLCANCHREIHESQ